MIFVSRIVNLKSCIFLNFPTVSWMMQWICISESLFKFLYDYKLSNEYQFLFSSVEACAFTSLSATMREYTFLDRGWEVSAPCSIALSEERAVLIAGKRIRHLCHRNKLMPCPFRLYSRHKYIAIIQLYMCRCRVAFYFRREWKRFDSLANTPRRSGYRWARRFVAAPGIYKTLTWKVHYIRGRATFLVIIIRASF